MSADLERMFDNNNNGWYPYPPTGELFASVTTVIEGTQSKPWLEGWSARLAVEWTLNNLRLLEEWGRERFEKEAVQAAKRSREVKADVGSYAHSVVEALILWQASPEHGAEIALPSIPEHLAGAYVDELPVEDFAEMCLDGFLNFVADHQPEFQASEMKVYHPELRVAGTLDIITLLRLLGITACVDVKTGKVLGVGVLEQLAAYRRMRQCLLPMGELADMPVTDSGMVLHLRPEYERGYRLLEVAGADDTAAWNRFRRAARLMRERAEVKGKPGRVLYPPLPDGTQPPTRLADLDAEGYGRALSPLIRAGLATVTDVAAFTEADCLEVKGIGAKTIETIARMLADHGLSFADTKEEVA